MITIEETIDLFEKKAKNEKERAFNDAVFWNKDTEYAQYCRELSSQYLQLAEWLKELQANRKAWEKCIKEIKEWYWNADKQAIAKDPCVVDAMVDLFIRTIKECRPKEGENE